ncbi:1-acyl-sn-glycerol-3-phosphate acyltransferase 1, chloroplastic isoform X2 [Arachis ipaensis]|uniref:1-acyl-sn-glycerol-3-phosphate acyltransferase 1, chloroplastic isoform X2 n=1 Tax=Arachis ipaensis TaxID=130454 RepID=UPI0007AF67CD|nr:1-acyl-sn-glycerol-3-phosphate acyltransferase 1, chloroplastic isoform X2 [Arachis ipaensis]
MSSVRALLSTSLSQSPLSSMFLNSSPSMEMFQLCTYKRPTYDHQVLRTSLSYAQRRLAGIPRKHRNALWVSFCPNEELCRPHCSCNLRYQNKHARDTVARCELAAAGDSHSLSGRSFKFISKTGIFLFPIIGWAMFLLGTIPLKRMDSRSQMDCLKRCMDLIRKGASVFFFPEGTRSKDGKLGAFKKGAFSIAAKTNAPVVPITLIGTGQIMPAGREGIVNVGWVKVVIHKPLGGKDAEMLCKEARTTIASVL